MSALAADVMARLGPWSFYALDTQVQNLLASLELWNEFL